MGKHDSSLADIAAFAGVFVTLNKPQREAFVKHITSEQCWKIRNMCYNLLFNSSINLADRDRRYLRRNVQDIRKLASKRICLEDKRGVLSAKQLLIRKICVIVVGYYNSNRGEEGGGV